MKPISPEREARSRRVQSLMEMTGLSRREFSRTTGISHSTLQHWESTSTHGLPERSAKRFIKALAVFGIECSYEWLLYGNGQYPKRFNRLELIDNKLQKNADFLIREEPSVYSNDNSQTRDIAEELEFFLYRHKEAVEYVVPDDAMQPRFITGELVAGIRRYGTDIEKLIDLDCIVLVEGGDIFLRTLRRGNLPGHYHLTHTNLNTVATKPFIYDVKLVSAAPVIWARRKDYL